MGARLRSVFTSYAARAMRFAVKFLGCKVSQADAMLARRELLAAGHEEVADADAELHVINTCCITREAEAKSRQSARRSLQSAGQVFVGGCAVNLHPEQFSEIAPAVQAFQGTAEEVAAAMARAGRPVRGAAGETRAPASTSSTTCSRASVMRRLEPGAGARAAS